MNIGLDMTYREKEKAANWAEISQSYDGCCSTAEISGVHMTKPDSVAYSDKQVSLEESVHSDLAETTMEPTSDTSNGEASSTQISCKIGSCESCESCEGEKEEEVVVVVSENENIVNGKFCGGEITENLSHESRDEEGEGRFHISPNHEEDGSHHTLANGNFSICVSSPNRSHNLHDSHESQESHEPHESHESHESLETHESHEVKKKPEEEEEGTPLVSSAHEEDESHHTLANGNLSISVASPNRSHDSHYSHESHEVKKKVEEEGIPLVSSHLEEDESQHTLANGSLSICVNSPNRSHDSHDSHYSHDSNYSHNSYEVKKKPEDEEEGISRVSSDHEEDESHHTLVNGILSTCGNSRSYNSHESRESLDGDEHDEAKKKPREEEEWRSHDSCEFEGVKNNDREKVLNKLIQKEEEEKDFSGIPPTIEDHQQNYDGTKELKKPDEEQKDDESTHPASTHLVEVESHESHGLHDDKEEVENRVEPIDEDEGDSSSQGVVLDQIANFNGFSTFFPTQASILGIKFGSVDCDEFPVSNSGFRFPGPSPIYHVNINGGSEVDTTVDEWNGSEAGVVVEPEAGVVVGLEDVVVELDTCVAVEPEVGVVVEAEWAMDDEATDYIANGSEVGEGREERGREGLSCDMSNGENTQTKLEKRGFYYLIKIPRFSDDDIREKMKNCQLLVHEKTRIRDDIRSMIQHLRTSCKEHGDKIEMAMSEEKSARDALRCKRREIDSVMNVINKVKNAISIDDIDAKIRDTEHTMEHGSLKLAEEKKLIHEIKQLKRQRDQLASNLDNNEDLDRAFAEKDNMDKQLKELRKEAVCLREVVSRTEQTTKEARKGYFGEREKLNELQSEFKEADNARQSAYANLLEERKHLSDKNKYFRMYKQNSESAYGYAAASNREGLQSLCINQVEKVMQLWNTNEEFRFEYIRANTRSTLWRLKTPDGRSLSPDHAPPPTFTLPKTHPPLNHPPETATPLPPTNTVLEDERRTPMKKRRKAVEEVRRTAVEERHMAEERRRTVEEEERRRTAEKEEHRRTAEEEERRRTAEEERRRGETAAQRKEEEKAKEKVAEQRKRRNAEKASVRAEIRALKEAQQKEKEREKRVRKKERKKAAAEVGGDGEIECPVTISLPEENPTREKVAKGGRPGMGKRTEGQKAAKGPPRVLIKNRGRSRVRHFLWVVPLFIFTLSTIGIVMWTHRGVLFPHV